MSLTGIITFIAGTKAKASEVNNNFTKVKSFVDNLETDIATNTADIVILQDDKADLNGNPAVRFSVADAINDTDAVNKQTAYEYMYNSRRYIDGLILTKTSANTISITAGSAYDSTFEQIMILGTGTSKTNSTQSISTTYYIYLIAKANGTSTDVLISTSSSNPPLPTDYVYYREIGLYGTDADNEIIYVQSNSNSPTRYKYDYANAIVYDNLGGDNDKDTVRTAVTDGLVYMWGGDVSSTSGYYLDGVLYLINGADSQGTYGGGFAEITKGQTYQFYRGSTWKFIPKVAI